MNNIMVKATITFLVEAQNKTTIDIFFLKKINDKAHLIILNNIKLLITNRFDSNKQENNRF